MNKKMIVWVIGLAVAATVTACGGTPTTAAPATSNSAATSADVLSLVGTWVTPTVSQSRVTAQLADANLAAAVDTVITDMGFPTAWTLTFTDATFSVTSSTGVQVDTGVYTLTGDTPTGYTLTMTPSCTKDDQPVTCTVTYALTLDGDTLTFDLVSDNSPDYLGTPDEAFQHALYMTTPFTRLSS